MYDNKDNCIVSIDIEEGNQKVLRSILVPGYPDLQQELLIVFDGELIIPFDYYLLQEQKATITAYLSERGYTNIEIAYDLHETDSGIELIWSVTGDTEEMKIGRPVLLGESVVPYHKIAREFTFKKEIHGI